MIGFLRLAATASLVLLSSLALASPSPSPADVAASLDAALASNDEDDLLDALAAAGTSGDATVVDRVVGTLDDRRVAVREAAVDALGRIRAPAAVEALHAALKKSTKARDSDAAFAGLLKAIGRQGDPSSVEVLADDPFERLTIDAGKARIMGLGRIRTKASLDALAAMSRKASPSARRGRGNESKWAGSFRDAMRCSAVVLTGKDFGSSRQDWEKYLRDEGESAPISPQRPAVPADVRVYWERYWDEPYDPKGRLPAGAQTGAPFEIVANPAADVVKDAVEELKDAFASGEKPEARVAAIQENAGVVHADVVYQVARGLRDADRRVRMASIEALGWSPHPDALKQLHRMFRREKDLNKDEEVYGALLKAIGRHSDPTSVEVLLEDPFKGGLAYAAGRARILGLARIRTQHSVEEIFQALTLGGGDSNRRGGLNARPRFLDDMRLALAVLTGEDKGPSKDAWQVWWRENKRTFKIKKERPPIAPELRARWETYWGEAY